MKKVMMLGAVAALLAPACGGSDEGASPVAPSPSVVPEGEQSANETDPEDVETGETVPPLVTAPSGIAVSAISDLAGRLGVDESSIVVVASSEVTWRDGSLGCPEPGMMYTQALVQGSLVVLEANGVQYRYHSAQSRDPFLCLNPTEPLEAESPPANSDL